MYLACPAELYPCTNSKPSVTPAGAVESDGGAPPARPGPDSHGRGQAAGASGRWLTADIYTLEQAMASWNRMPAPRQGGEKVHRRFRQIRPLLSKPMARSAHLFLYKTAHLHRKRKQCEFMVAHCLTSACTQGSCSVWTGLDASSIVVPAKASGCTSFHWKQGGRAEYCVKKCNILYRALTSEVVPILRCNIPKRWMLVFSI